AHMTLTSLGGARADTPTSTVATPPAARSSRPGRDEARAKHDRAGVVRGREQRPDSRRPDGRDHTQVLIVDDDPMVRRLVGVTLEDEGYDVAVAADGEEGVRIALE